MKIKNLNFELTCSGYPEQYDVYRDGVQVGYVRLRWGHLTVEYPKACDEIIYSEQFDERHKGEFDNQEEREAYLNKCADVLLEKLNNIENSDRNE